VKKSGSHKDNCKICRSEYRAEHDSKLFLGPLSNQVIKSEREKFGVSKSMMTKHLKESATEVVQSKDYTAKIVDVLEDTINDTREIIQEARGEQLYTTALNGMRILAGILETQAKILGIADKHASKSNQTLHLHMSVPPSEVSKMAEDYKSTVEVLPSDD
jgi:hypothetical protein